MLLLIAFIVRYIVQMGRYEDSPGKSGLFIRQKRYFTFILHHITYSKQITDETCFFTRVKYNDFICSIYLRFVVTLQ